MGPSTVRGQALTNGTVVGMLPKTAVYLVKAEELASVAGTVDVLPLEGFAQVEEQQLGQGGNKLAIRDDHIVNLQAWNLHHPCTAGFQDYYLRHN